LGIPPQNCTVASVRYVIAVSIIGDCDVHEPPSVKGARFRAVEPFSENVEVLIVLG